MALCFIANKDLTVNFERIARWLVEGGERVVWLSPSRRWSHWLVKQGWSEVDILTMADHEAQWRALSPQAARDMAAPYETDPSLTAAHAIRMCRGLSRRPARLAEAYFSLSLSLVDAFLETNAVDIILGEGTWGFEIAVGMVARKRGIPHLCPSIMRIPTDRFGFVDAVTGALWTPFAVGEVERDSAAQSVDAWLAQPRPPVFASGPYASLEKAWVEEAKIALFSRTLDKGDETLWPLHRRISDRVRRAWRARRLGALLKGGAPSGKAPFLLICLQHQPEAAVDVFGGFHSNQDQLIETVVRMAPAQCEVVVREHKGAVGDRSLAWYKRIGGLPKVILGDPFAPIYPLINSAAAVISISSTVAFESALLGTPALLLAPVHFSGLTAVPPTRMSHPLEWPLADIMDPAQRERWTPTRQAKIDLFALIIANSAVGECAVLRAGPEITGHADWLKKEADFFAKAFAQFRTKRDAGLMR